MFYCLILLNLSFLIYFLIRIRKNDLNILDIYLFSFWIVGLLYFTISYYFEPNTFDQKALSATLALILLHLATIIFLKYTIFKKYTLKYLFNNLIKISQVWFLVILVAIVAIELIIIIKYGFIFNIATSGAEYHNYSYWLTSFIIFVPPIFFGLLGFFILNLSLFKKQKILLILIILLLTIIFFINIFAAGRREMFYFVSLFIFGLFTLNQTNFFKNLGTKVIISLILISILPFAFNYFQNVRENFYALSSAKTQIKKENSWENLKQDLNYTFTNKNLGYPSTSESLKSRDSIIDFIYLIVFHKQNLKINLNNQGEILKTSLNNLLPRIFLPNNKSYINSDQIINRLMGLDPNKDVASALIIDFLIDWGIYFGAVLSALFLGLTMLILIWISKWGKPLTKFYIFGTIIITAFYLETTTTTILGFLRNVLFLLIIENLIFYFLKPPDKIKK